MIAIFPTKKLGMNLIYI